MPAGEVTTISFAPADEPAGVTPVIVVELTRTKEVIATPLTVAPVAPVKLVPVMVIDVPPRITPEVGETEVTVIHWAYKVTSTVNG